MNTNVDISVASTMPPAPSGICEAQLDSLEGLGKQKEAERVKAQTRRAWQNLGESVAQLHEIGSSAFAENRADEKRIGHGASFL